MNARSGSNSSRMSGGTGPRAASGGKTPSDNPMSKTNSN